MSVSDQTTPNLHIQTPKHTATNKTHILLRGTYRTYTTTYRTPNIQP